MEDTLTVPPEVSLPERLKFSDIFLTNPDGSLTPKVIIEVNGVTVGPGVSFRPKTPIGGVDFFDYLNKDFAVEDIYGRYKLLGYYN